MRCTAKNLRERARGTAQVARGPRDLSKRPASTPLSRTSSPSGTSPDRDAAPDGDLRRTLQQVRWSMSRPARRWQTLRDLPELPPWLDHLCQPPAHDDLDTIPSPGDRRVGPKRAARRGGPGPLQRPRPTQPHADSSPPDYRDSQNRLSNVARALGARHRRSGEMDRGPPNADGRQVSDVADTEGSGG